MAKNINPTKVITGKDTRWSYCNVWDAKSINGGTPKFSVSLIIPKSDTRTVAKIKTKRPFARSRLPSMPLIMTARASCALTARPCPRWWPSRTPCATATRSAPTIWPTRTLTSSTRTLPPRRVW